MTANDIFKKVRILLDEYTEDGIEIPEADVIDLQKKTILLIDMAQRELFKENKNYKTFEFAHTPIDNMVETGFEMLEYIGETKYMPSEEGVIGAKAYHIEVDDEAGIDIQEKRNGVWTTLETLDTIDVEDFTVFKGIITPLDDTNEIRYKIYGSTYYRYRNIALFDIPFASDRIPNYAPYFKVELPNDFRSIETIVKEEWQTSKQYTTFTDFKWEGSNELYVSWFFDGNVRIKYNAIPTPIADINGELSVDDIASDAIVYFVTAKVAPYENKDLVNYYEQKFNDFKFSLKTNQPVASTQVENVYGDCNG